MNTYLALIHKDDDSAYGVSFPDLPGCFSADLAAGAFLVAIPHICRSTKQQRVNISLDAGTLDAIDTAAQSMKLTRSAFIALAAANQIKGAL